MHTDTFPTTSYQCSEPLLLLPQECLSWYVISLFCLQDKAVPLVMTRRQLVGDGLWGDYSGVVCCVLFYCIFYNFCALPLWDHMEHISMLSTLLPACSFIFSVHPVRVEDPPSRYLILPVMVWSGSPHPCASRPKIDVDRIPVHSPDVDTVLSGWGLDWRREGATIVEGIVHHQRRLTLMFSLAVD